ncbi:class I SAM-dependent methyltransferase [Candidatus Falkowbacteria bacterium]|nr:class I SAM-dependent methyltransferase [Candidatus Falkowbacteria bacterium]
MFKNLFLNSNKESDFNKINYQTFSSEASLKEYDKAYLRSFEEPVVEKYFKKGAFILDLGCGAGRTTAVLYQRGFQIIGVDIAESLIGLAEKRHPGIDFQIGDAANLNFAHSTFDIVFFSFNGLDYLHPIGKRFKAIKEIRRVLKPNGLFVYSSHNAFSIPMTKMSFKTFFDNLFSLRIFSSYRLEKLAIGNLLTYHGNLFKEIKDLEKSGFKFMDIFGFGRATRSKNKFLLSLFFKYISYVFQKV